jgi:HK97 gp10 family phage protein
LPRRKGQTISYQAKQDVARLSGVNISIKTGRATFGGTLRKSIKIQRVKRTGFKVHRRVKAGAPYAKYVEFPTVRTKAQPFLLPAFKRFGTAQELGRAMRR